MAGLAYDAPLPSDRAVKNTDSNLFTGASTNIAPTLANILIGSQAMKAQAPTAPVGGTVLSAPPSVNWGQAMPQQPMQPQIVPSQNLSTISTPSATQPQQPMQPPTSMYQRWAARHAARGRPV